MIFTKEASFPYPILSGLSEAYQDNTFEIEIDLQENTNDYYFSFDYVIGSTFIQDLLNQKQAKLIAIIRSNDNKFFDINENNRTVIIPKTRISLSKRTAIQMMIRAEDTIFLKQNNDLIDAYSGMSEKITIPKHGLLGISNVVYYDGNIKKPYEIFEKKVNKDLKSDIQIELGVETIIIHYKSEDMQFPTHPNSKILNYPYLYLGLQKALMMMIEELSDGEGIICVSEIEIPENPLQTKLLNLIKSKKVEKVDYECIDEVIYKISDRLIEKYTHSMKGIQENGN